MLKIRTYDGCDTGAVQSSNPDSKKTNKIEAWAISNKHDWLRIATNRAMTCWVFRVSRRVDGLTLPPPDYNHPTDPLSHIRTRPLGTVWTREHHHFHKLARALLILHNKVVEGKLVLEQKTLGILFLVRGLWAVTGTHLQFQAAIIDPIQKWLLIKKLFCKY